MDKPHQMDNLKIGSNEDHWRKPALVPMEASDQNLEWLNWTNP